MAASTDPATPDNANDPAAVIAAAVADASGHKPVVVADQVHVEYQVLATGRKAPGYRSILGRTRGIQTVHALRGVSFVARENESIGVVGHNGSGKSTLMRAITGLTPATRGAIYAASRPSLLGVGAALIGDLSGRRNVILGGLALGFTRPEIEERYDDIVDFSGIREFIDMPMRTYSSGMSARLKFAIATAKAHDILIVDEALSVGDKEFQRRSEERIRGIRDAAGTVFLVSHSMKSIRDTCDRVLWVHKGELRLDGPADEVIKAYEAAK